MTTAAELVRRFIPWSHSKVQLAEKCPRAFHFKYVDRFGSKEGTEARVGTAAHTYLEHRRDGLDEDEARALAEKSVRGMTADELETLAERNVASEAYVERTRVFRDKGLVLHEAQEVRLGIEPNGAPCDYEDPKALIRGSVDDLIEQRDGKALVIDHKSGRDHDIAHYMPQLNTYKVLTIQNRPHLRHVQAGVHHIQKGDLIWQRADTKVQVQTVLLPWLIRRIEQAARGLDGFEPKTSTLCWWCDYQFRCPEGLAVPKPASIKKKEAAERRRLEGPKMKKDGTPYATRAKRSPEPGEVMRPEDFDFSASELFPRDEDVIL